MKVYKYRGGDKESSELHFSTLVQDQFWAAAADKLNDPAEAFVNDALARASFQSIGAADVVDRYDELVRMRHTVGVFSLSRTPFDELMWAYYAGGHAGFCVEYDLDRLCLEARDSWRIVDVVYHETPQTILAADVLAVGDDTAVLSKMIGTKSVRWRHEQELRIVTTTPGLNSHAAEAVTGVYFGCRCDPAFMERLQCALNGRAVKFFRMRFTPTSYAMAADELKPAAGPAQVALAPVDAGAIPDLHLIKEAHRPYHAFLGAAVDRVRRDASCARVLCVDFGSKHDAEGLPMVFVMYQTRVKSQRADTLNRFFSIRELADWQATTS